MIELMRTNDITLVAFAKALLAAEGITCFELDVHMSVMEGSIGIMPRRLMIAERDVFQAHAILKDNDVEISTS